MSNVSFQSPNTSTSDLKSYINRLQRVKKFQIESYTRSTNKDVKRALDDFYSTNSKGVVIFIEQR